MNITRINLKICFYIQPVLFGLFLTLLLLLAEPVRADVVMPAGKAQTHAMAGGFALLREPGQTQPYQSTTDPGVFPSFPVWFDTGSSGNLIAYTVASDLAIPTTGETFSDVGIGGGETFDVSQSTELLLVPSLKQPTYGDLAYADLMGSYSSYGGFNLQLRQQERWLDEALTGYYNIIGTPVLNNYVMRVRPNSLVHQFDLSLLGGPCPMLYMETALLDELPTGLPPSLTIEIPLVYNNYVPGDPPVNTATNPVIPGVKLADALSSMVPTTGRDWLFDSGASVTIISKSVASEVGLDQNTPVVSTAQIGGIGGAIDIFGYEIDELILPSNDETQLTFTDAVVYVIDWENSVDLPAGLSGIFGMNLIDKSIDDAGDGLFIDWLGFIHPEYLSDSPFVQWYVDPFGSQLVLLLNLPGDFDEDGDVDGVDFGIWQANYSTASGATLGTGDADGDGDVDGVDFGIWQANYPTSLGAAVMEATPEPATLLLLGAGILVFTAFRPRSRPRLAFNRRSGTL